MNKIHISTKDIKKIKEVAYSIEISKEEKAKLLNDIITYNRVMNIISDLEKQGIELNKDLREVYCIYSMFDLFELFDSYKEDIIINNYNEKTNKLIKKINNKINIISNKN